MKTLRLKKKYSKIYHFFHCKFKRQCFGSVPQFFSACFKKKTHSYHSKFKKLDLTCRIRIRDKKNRIQIYEKYLFYPYPFLKAFIRIRSMSDRNRNLTYRSWIKYIYGTRIQEKWLVADRYLLCGFMRLFLFVSKHNWVSLNK